jgi:hypothetical protein
MTSWKAGQRRAIRVNGANPKKSSFGLGIIVEAVQGAAMRANSDSTDVCDRIIGSARNAGKIPISRKNPSKILAAEEILSLRPRPERPRIGPAKEIPEEIR